MLQFSTSLVVHSLQCVTVPQRDRSQIFIKVISSRTHIWGGFLSFRVSFFSLRSLPKISHLHTSPCLQHSFLWNPQLRHTKNSIWSSSDQNVSYSTWRKQPPAKMFDPRLENQIWITKFIKYLKFHVTENFWELTMPYQITQMMEGVGPRILISSFHSGD